jgi:ankyrin repeat protein
MGGAKDLVAHFANLEAKDNFGMTPSAWAAFKGRVEVLEDFAARNANLEAKDDKCGMTPIALAAAVGQWEAVKDLLVRNADLEAKGKYGMTPIALDSIHRPIGDSGRFLLLATPTWRPRRTGIA